MAAYSLIKEFEEKTNPAYPLHVDALEIGEFEEDRGSTVGGLPYWRRICIVVNSKNAKKLKLNAELGTIFVGSGLTRLRLFIAKIINKKRVPGLSGLVAGKVEVTIICNYSSDFFVRKDFRMWVGKK